MAGRAADIQQSFDPVWRRTGGFFHGRCDKSANEVLVDMFAAGTPAGVGAGLALAAGVALVVVLFAGCIRQHQPWPVLVYVATLAALAPGAKGYFASKPRFFVPVFPLWFPLALWLSTRSQRIVAAGLVIFAVGSAAYGAVWLHGGVPP